MTSSLIVNADDYGRTEQVSLGIREAHQRGIVTSTTVLINLPASESDLVLASRETPQLGIGLHLNLTLGTPILPSECIPSLVGVNGQFLGRPLLFQRIRDLDPEEVYAEWQAQIEHMASIYQLPDHLDSHHHVALLSSETWAACLRLAREFNCPVRSPIPADLGSEEIGTILPPSSVEFVGESAGVQLKESGIPAPDHFLASFFGAGASRLRLESLLGQIKPGVTELMCHPGYSNEELAQSSGYADERNYELSLLTDPSLKEFIHATGWTLTDFSKPWTPGFAA